MTDSLSRAGGKAPAGGPGGLPKRLLDFLLALLLIACLSPLMALVAGGILLARGRPILVKDEMLGLNGRTFGLLRFRIGSARKVKVRDAGRADPIVMVRECGIEYLPALLNVLGGDMSMVGPAPRSSREISMAGARGEDLLAARPGLVSPAKLAGELDPSELRALDIDRTFVLGYGSLLTDLRLLGRSLFR